MSFAETRLIEPRAIIHADVCVVGAGPAGLAVSLDLARSGLRVALLESGGFATPPASPSTPLGASEIVNTVLARRFGGTQWYGRCVPLDCIDFEARPWVPLSGWPISQQDVESRYPDAAAFLGLDPDVLAGERWKHDPTSVALDGDGIAACPHLITRTKDLARRHRRTVADSSRLTVFLQATVTGVDVDQDSRVVSRLRARGPDGREFSARAGRYVLACGGLENARILLTLAADRQGVFGPSSAALGCYYMNHARCEGIARLRLDTRHPHYRTLFRSLTEGHCRQSRCSVQIGARLDETVQHREELLNAGAFFYPASAAPVEELRGLLDALARRSASGELGRTDLRRVRRLARGAPLLLGAALARARRNPFLLDSLIMVEQLEQAPRPDSRIVLDGQPDRFGYGRVKLDWRIGDGTLRTQRRFHRLLADRLRKSGVGTLESALLDDADLEPLYGDAAHPMGTTRMSIDSREGVVDCNCRVHMLDNLYVAGSSVFPTGGQANPTLALVALAFRLAAHLRALCRA